MKKLYLLITGIIFLSGQGFAQQDTTDLSPVYKSPSRISMLKNQVFGANYWNDKFRGNWAGIFIGVNGFTQADYSNYSGESNGFMDLDLIRSNVVDLNLLQFSKGLQNNRNTIGLVTGVGLEIQSFHFDNAIQLSKGSGKIEPIAMTYDDNIKSKLTSIYMNVPLLAEFQLPVKNYANRFYFSTGIVLGSRLSSQTKIKYKEDGQKQKLKIPGDFYMHKFRYSATVRMGYRWLNLFAAYDLRPIFKKDKGPELYPYSVGIALVSF